MATKRTVESGRPSRFRNDPDSAPSIFIFSKTKEKQSESLLDINDWVRSKTVHYPFKLAGVPAPLQGAGALG